MDRINLNYEGFTPDHESVQKFKASFGYALGKGPSDASATATVTQENDQYMCSVKVHSVHGHFYIDVNAKDLDTLYKQTCTTLVEQFTEWHADPTNEKFSHR